MPADPSGARLVRSHFGEVRGDRIGVGVNKQVPVDVHDRRLGLVRDANHFVPVRLVVGDDPFLEGEVAWAWAFVPGQVTYVDNPVALSTQDSRPARNAKAIRRVNPRFAFPDVLEHPDRTVSVPRLRVSRVCTLVGTASR